MVAAATVSDTPLNRLGPLYSKQLLAFCHFIVLLLLAVEELAYISRPPPSAVELLALVVDAIPTVLSSISRIEVLMIV